MKSAQEIMLESSINPRASFYAGRGENLGDLNSEMLNNMYDIIERDIGKDAGKSFTNTIVDLCFKAKDLSASTFITTVYNLERAEWKYSSEMKTSNKSDHYAIMAADEIRNTGKPTLSMLMLQLELMGVNSSSKDDEYSKHQRKSICHEFIYEHGNALTKENAQLVKEEGLCFR